jgi:hypothetical protein
VSALPPKPPLTPVERSAHYRHSFALDENGV